MAEVLYPLIPGNTPISMLQSRPTSADTLSSTQHQHQNQSRLNQMPRPNTNHTGVPGYRGTSAAPLPTYAFKATPQLRNDMRTTSAGAASQTQPLADSANANRQRYPAPESISTTSSSTSTSTPSSTLSTNPTWSSLFQKDDSVLASNFQVAPFTTPSEAPDLNSDKALAERPVIPVDTPAKSSPDRYRRGQRRIESSNSVVQSQQSQQASKGNAPHLAIVTPATTIPSAAGGPAKLIPVSYANAAAGTSPSEQTTNSMQAENQQADAGTDDLKPSSVGSTQEQKAGPSSFSRYRRRSSLGTMETNVMAAADDSKNASVSPTVESPMAQRSQDGRPSSSGSVTPRPELRGGTSNRQNGPARTFAEVARRTNNPSPLSRPLTPGDSAAQPASPPSPSMMPATMSNSPAVAAMAALNDKDAKGVKSRLRRAFSFGSTAELRRATGEADTAAERARLRKEQFSLELDEEQDAIAQQQEAGGLGNNIYSGQAGFTGSTDNLSISSTASSASMMLRKMGKGMKKGGRSIKGLFRPKSVIGVAPPDEPIQPRAQVSMVTVEAEREKVNVNADPHDQVGGGTGYPKLERNSLDAARVAGLDNDSSRRSIVGGENERAEILAAVKRGILKKSGTSSPNGQPSAGSLTIHDNFSAETRHSAAGLNNNASNGQATGSNGGDYFTTVSRFGNQSSKSLPGTPKGNRGIQFSPRIQFHDVWSSQEYDRRGDIATCNRLTPMLAQQIKEELNTFKMVSYRSS